jgi:hypothetical protein
MVSTALWDKLLNLEKQDNLLIFIQAGMKIRVNNMGIAKSNVQVIRGLAQVRVS